MTERLTSNYVRRALAAIAAAAVSVSLLQMAAQAFVGESASIRGADPAAKSHSDDRPLAYRDQYLPLGLVAYSGPFATPRALPSRTPTITPTPTTTNTPTITATAGPSPTPTRPIVSHPTDPDVIVLQVGWSNTDQPGNTWEEMNGTPYFTLFGDGRLIAGHMLFDWQQPLYEAAVDERQIQEWLYDLTYDVEFFTLEGPYEHPDYSKFEVHVFARYGMGSRDLKRISIAGFTRWLKGPLPDLPDAHKVGQLAEFVKRLEAFATGAATIEYLPDTYTILSMEVNPHLPSPPRWTHPLDIAAISDSAPLRWGGGYVHGPPGHKVVDGALGLEVTAVVAADARRDWPGLNMAAEYASGGRRFVVGARKEVPHGSDFLPGELHDEWYRVDD